MKSETDRAEGRVGVANDRAGWRRSGMVWVAVGLGIGIFIAWLPALWPNFDSLPGSGLAIFVPMGIAAGGLNRVIWGPPGASHRVPRPLRLVLSIVAALCLFKLVGVVVQAVFG